jgi:YgiT-type zinc finger domain-containing protein
MNNGTVTVTLQRDERIILVKNVPAHVCNNCGDYTLSEAVTIKLMEMADHTKAQPNTEVEVLSYAA